MENSDYYTTLGLTKDATQQDVKKAYRRLARQYHPDVSKHADAGQRMAQINEANDVLSDSTKRSAYDQVGHKAWMQGARSPDDLRAAPGSRSRANTRQPGQEEYSEFFEDLFRASG